MKDIEMMSLQEIVDELRSEVPTDADRRQRLWLWLDVMTKTASPDKTTLSENEVSAQREPFDHPCKICGGEAPFGYGVSLLKGEEGTWYCADHRPAAIDEAAE